MKKRKDRFGRGTTEQALRGEEVIRQVDNQYRDADRAEDQKAGFDEAMKLLKEGMAIEDVRKAVVRPPISFPSTPGTHGEISNTEVHNKVNVRKAAARQVGIEDAIKTFQEQTATKGGGA